MSKNNMNRRTFLKVTSIAGSSLLVGCTFDAPKIMSSDNTKETELGLWVRIDKNENITLILPSSEMGQHAHTGQAMILAEELDADWDSIRVVTASNHDEFKNPLLFNMQRTDGSKSIMAFWDKLRIVGAGTRQVLLSAAAQEWNVPEGECIAHKGYIRHEKSGRELSYGHLAFAASQISPPENPSLKTSDQFKLIGKSVPKLHTPDKVSGKAEFGTDVRIPGMLYAAICQSPVFGGEIKSYDEVKAKSVNGVEAIVKIPNGLAVVADTTWHANQGLKVLNCEFEGGDTIDLDSSKVSAKFRSALDEMGKAKLIQAKSLDVEYEMPFLHHATMEPMNCTAYVTSNSCEIWVPTQNQEDCMNAAKEVTGFSEKQITINTTLLGGGFGRRGEKDFVTQALIVSKAIQKPVQVIWSREEDTQHGFYRPASMSRFQIELDNYGLPSKWESQIAQPNLFSRWVPPFGWLDFDPLAVAATVHDYGMFPNHFYEVENVNSNHTGVELGVPIGPWRAPPNSLNVFYTESVVDELAYLANQDPLTYRLNLMPNSPRHKEVLEKVAKQAGWNEPLKEGHGRGIAINDWFPLDENKTIVAQVVELSINKRGKVKINRVDCVVDCGLAVNPDSIKSQMEGAIVMGISSTLFEQITIKNGRVLQSNFDDYRIARMKDTPKIEVSIIEREAIPTGIGEPGAGPITPAITNAIFAASGKRIRKLPLARQSLT